MKIALAFRCVRHERYLRAVDGGPKLVPNLPLTAQADPKVPWAVDLSDMECPAFGDWLEAHPESTPADEDEFDCTAEWAVLIEAEVRA